jgi:hypothetical protein
MVMLMPRIFWCLDGKASEYYALLVERNQDMAYKNLIIKIEKRFGFRELPETAQVQFSNAHHAHLCITGELHIEHFPV